MRNLALFERELCASSSAVACFGLPSKRISGLWWQTQTGSSDGQMQPRAISLSVCFAMRSSSEWKVMIAMRPPGFR